MGCYLVVFGVFVLGGGDALLVEVVEGGLGVGHEDGGVGGDDELGALLGEFVYAGEEGELALGGEGGFGFVENVEAVGSEAV